MAEHCVIPHHSHPQLVPEAITTPIVSSHLLVQLRNLPTREEFARALKTTRLHLTPCQSHQEEQQRLGPDNRIVPHTHNTPQPTTHNLIMLLLLLVNLQLLPLAPGPTLWRERRRRPKQRVWTTISTELWSWRASRGLLAKSLLCEPPLHLLRQPSVSVPFGVCLINPLCSLMLILLFLCASVLYH